MLNEYKISYQLLVARCLSFVISNQRPATSNKAYLTFITLCFLCFALCTDVHAARPLVTEDAAVAGKGITQFEAGLDYVKVKNVGEGATLLLSPIHGVAEETEFSLKIPYIFGRPDTPSTVEGWGDTSFIMKHLIAEEGDSAPALLLRMAIKLPTGDKDKGLGTGDTSVGFLGVVTKNIGLSTIHLNIGYAFVGDQKDDANNENEVNYGIAGEYSVGSKTRVVGEIYGLYHPDYKGKEIERRALMGLTYRLDDTFTMDIAAKRGLENAGDEYGIAGGITITF